MKRNVNFASLSTFFSATIKTKMRNYLKGLDHGNNRISQSLQTKKILQFLLQEGEKTIPEIKDFVGLSLPTTTKIVNELLEINLLQETRKRESSGGRPPTLYGLKPDEGFIVGVELLQRSFRMSIINLSHELIFEYQTPDFDISQKEESFDFLAKMIPQLIHQQGVPEQKILGVGIGIAGLVNSKLGISYSYLHYAQPLVPILSKQWSYPVFVDNDSHLMTLGEQAFGLARNRQNVLYINLNRGLGIGVISNGAIHCGESGFAGEFGHIHFQENDVTCVCGNKGCLETVVSGSALERQYAEQSSTDENLHYKDILKLGVNGDPFVNQLLKEMGENLGRGLSNPIQVLNPGLIILGGTFTEVGELMRYSILRGLTTYGLPQLIADAKLEVSTLGEKTAMLGAYALVMENVFL